VNDDLTTVVIPTSVRVISDYAFLYCPALKCVQVNSSAVQFNHSIVFDQPLENFANCTNNVVV
jgi:hypothetical protein